MTTKYLEIRVLIGRRANKSLNQKKEKSLMK
jgi:hypothetical protein